MAECLPPELVLHINLNAVRAIVFTKQAVAVRFAHITKKPMQDDSGVLNCMRKLVAQVGTSLYFHACSMNPFTDQDARWRVDFVGD
eukprot:183847-Pyramimonas_sp.AAC.1